MGHRGIASSVTSVTSAANGEQTGETHLLIQQAGDDPSKRPRHTIVVDADSEAANEWLGDYSDGVMSLVLLLLSVAGMAWARANPTTKSAGSNPSKASFLANGITPESERRVHMRSAY